jgi:hypothetical protein
MKKAHVKKIKIIIEVEAMHNCHLNSLVNWVSSRVKINRLRDNKYNANVITRKGVFIL